MIFRQRPGEASGFRSFEIPVNGRLTDGATSGYLILSEIHSEPQTQNVFDFSHRQPFLGQMAPSTSQWNEPRPAVVQRRLAKMNFRSEIHSGDVNKHSGQAEKFILFSPESIFTSPRNRYSHAPEPLFTCPGIRILSATST
jgi:hypothetical protein